MIPVTAGDPLAPITRLTRTQASVSKHRMAQFFSVTRVGAVILVLGASCHSQANHPVSSKPPFSVAVVPQGSNDHGRWISMRKAGFVEPLYVVLTNITREPQRVFESWNEWGYKAITFEVLTEDGQKAVVSRRSKDFDKNFPSTFIVPPGGHYVYTIELTEQDWVVAPSLRFSTLEPVMIHLKAIYQLTPTRASGEEKAWTGRAESEDDAFRLVHE